MELTRRQLLTGITGIAGLLAVGSKEILAEEALANRPRPFLYPLEDYSDPTKQPSQMRKLYLDELVGNALLVSWDNWCIPCGRKIPDYNQLYQRYGKQVQFVGALQRSHIESRRTPPPVSPAEYLYKCLSFALLEKYPLSEERLKAFQQINQQATLPSELAQLLKRCEENTLDAYNPTYFDPSGRAGLKEDQKRLQQLGKWPLFPTYVLDDEFSRRYLQGRTSLFITVLNNGKRVKTLGGKEGAPSGDLAGSVERELRKLTRL